MSYCVLYLYLYCSISSHSISSLCTLMSTGIKDATRQRFIQTPFCHFHCHTHGLSLPLLICLCKTPTYFHRHRQSFLFFSPSPIPQSQIQPHFCNFRLPTPSSSQLSSHHLHRFLHLLPHFSFFLLTHCIFHFIIFIYSNN